MKNIIMLKSVLLAGGSVFLLAGCSDNNTDESESVLAGRTMGFYEEMLIVFSGDNLADDRVVPVNHLEFDDSEYEAEAYKVSITENTRILEEETGEESRLTAAELAYLYGYPLQVETVEEFSREVQIRDEYIQTSQEGLPEYEAEEILLKPVGMEDFSHFVSTFYLPANGMTDEEEGYMILLTNGDEEATEDFHLNQTQYDAELEQFRTDERHISTGNNLGLTWGDYSDPVRLQDVMKQFQLPEEYLSSPTFLIFETNGFLTAENSWNEVIAYFHENVSE